MQYLFIRENLRTTYEDDIRQAAKADHILANAFRTQKDRAFPSRVKKTIKRKLKLRILSPGLQIPNRENNGEQWSIRQ